MEKAIDEKLMYPQFHMERACKCTIMVRRTKKWKSRTS